MSKETAPLRWVTRPQKVHMKRCFVHAVTNKDKERPLSGEFPSYTSLPDKGLNGLNGTEALKKAIAALVKRKSVRRPKA